MKNDGTDPFRSLIQNRIDLLLQNTDDTAESRATVMLDQQSIGRLSRMDALQQQAMSNATDARRNAEIAQLRAALSRIDAGAFGYCEDCGDAIPVKRLELLPTALLCVTCAAG